MKISTNMVDLKGMTIEQMGEYFESIGEQRYRAEQVFNSILKAC
jgi:hypothetical protein